MAASKNNNVPTPDLALPTSIAQTMRLVQRVAHNATWGERIAAHHQLPSAANFGPRLFRRFDAASTPGVWASAFAQRFVADELAPSTTELTLAPFAPAQRQLSAARQGALPWSGGDDFSPSWPTGSIARSPEPSAHHSLLNDLTASGWDVQSSAPTPAQRFAAPAPASDAAQPIRRSPDPQPAAQPIHRSPDPQPAAQPAAQPIHRSPDPQPAAQPATQPIHRSPDPQPATAPQSQSTLHRQADPGGADSSSDQSSTNDAAQTSLDESPSIETAATRPMSFFRGTPQNPLMRMGLPENPGDTGAGAAAPSAPLATPSGELPIVHRQADQSAAATPARIDRRAEPTAAPSQPGTPISDSGITSSDATDSANAARSSIDVPGDIQRTASDTPAHADPAPQAVANTSADLQPGALPGASAQRDSQAPADSSSTISAATPASTPDASAPAAAIARVAADPTAVPENQGGSQATSTTDGQAAPPATTVAPEQAGSASSDRPVTAPAGSSAPTTIARAPLDVASTVQRSGDAAAETSGSGAADDGPGQPNDVAAAHAPVINRQAAPSARPQAFDTVLPWANKLLQRYSMGDGQSTSASMPLLRTYAATPPLTVMRSSDHMSGGPSLPITRSGAADGSVSSMLPGMTSASSAISLPLVRRSAIIPALPQATLQREPATASGGSMAAAPAPAAPAALDWSALPLLQRLSVQHVVPAPAPSTTTGSAGSGSQSVAARLVQRLALDDPQATAAPMPLLRTQAPAQPSTLMRSMSQVETAGIGPATAEHAPAAMQMSDDSGGPFAGEQPTSAPGANTDQTAPLIHRSAVLPTWSGAAYQPLPLLRTHVPDAPGMIETSGWKDAETFQPLSQPTLGVPSAQPAGPTAMRAADQQSATLPAGEQSTPGMSDTVSSAEPPVHRSAIIPALPQATLQREPATVSGGSMAAVAPASAAPAALDWSALPLLQRLSVQHALPAAPVAAHVPASSQPSASDTSSVAARLVQRLALDDPHGTSAPMPLLRMQAPPAMPTSNDAEADTPEAHGSAAEPTTPILPTLVRRSAILPSLSGFAPSETGSPHAAATETAMPALQRADAANDWGVPTLQRSFGAFAGGLGRLRSKIPTLPSPASALGGLDQAFGGLGQHAQSALGQVTSGLGQHAQSALGQVTSGLPQLPLSQLTSGLPQSALSQVTSAMPRLPLLQQMNWQSAQQALGIPNMGIPNMGIPGADMPNPEGEAMGAADMPGMDAGVSESPLGGGAAPELPLLRPTRPESQAASEQSQNASADGATTPEPTSGSGGAAADVAGADGKAGKHDIEQLAQQVYARLRHRLLVDRERLRPF